MDIANGVDICDCDQLKDIGEVDVIVHLANLSFVPASYENPKRFYETNYLSTLNMLELCWLRNARMFFLGSCVYGHRGVTILDGMGWYSREPVKVITVIARKNESIKIFRIVKEIDPNAFISQSSAIGVYGEGFDVIKSK